MLLLLLPVQGRAGGLVLGRRGQATCGRAARCSWARMRMVCMVCACRQPRGGRVQGGLCGEGRAWPTGDRARADSRTWRGPAALLLPHAVPTRRRSPVPVLGRAGRRAGPVAHELQAAQELVERRGAFLGLLGGRDPPRGRGPALPAAAALAVVAGGAGGATAGHGGRAGWGGPRCALHPSVCFTPLRPGAAAAAPCQPAACSFGCGRPRTRAHARAGERCKHNTMAAAAPSHLAWQQQRGRAPAPCSTTCARSRARVHCKPPPAAADSTSSTTSPAAPNAQRTPASKAAIFTSATWTARVRRFCVVLCVCVLLGQVFNMDGAGRWVLYAFMLCVLCMLQCWQGLSM